MSTTNGTMAAELVIESKLAREALADVNRLAKAAKLTLDDLVKSGREFGHTSIDSGGKLRTHNREIDNTTKALREYRKEQGLQNYVARQGLHTLSNLTFALGFLTQGNEQASTSTKKVQQSLLAAVAAANATEYALFAVSNAAKSAGVSMVFLQRAGGWITAIVAVGAGLIAFFMDSAKAAKDLSKEIADINRQILDARYRQGVEEGEQYIKKLKRQLKELRLEESRLDRTEEGKKRQAEINQEETEILGKIKSTREDMRKRADDERKRVEQHQKKLFDDKEKEQREWEERRKQNFSAQTTEEKAHAQWLADLQKNADDNAKKAAEDEKKAMEEVIKLRDRELDAVARLGNALAGIGDSWLGKLNQALQIAIATVKAINASNEGTGSSLDIISSVLGFIGLFDEGGRIGGKQVGRPRLIVAHEGETVLPTHKYPLHLALAKGLSRSGGREFDTGGMVGTGQVSRDLGGLAPEVNVYLVGVMDGQRFLRVSYPEFERFKKQKDAK